MTMCECEDDDCCVNCERSTKSLTRCIQCQENYCVSCLKVYGGCQRCEFVICSTCVYECIRWGYFRRQPVEIKALDLPPLLCDTCFQIGYNDCSSTSVPYGFQCE